MFMYSFLIFVVGLQGTAFVDSKEDMFVDAPEELNIDTPGKEALTIDEDDNGEIGNQFNV